MDEALVFVYLIGLPVGYVTMLVLAWPWVAILVRHQKLNVACVCGGACFIGATVFAVFIGLVAGSEWLTFGDVPRLAGTGSLIGLISGLIFCAFAGVPMKSRN